MKLKKFLSVFVAAIILVALAALISTQVIAGNLGCESLSNCKGKASCGEPGTVNLCDIDCASGTKVECLPIPRK